VRIDDLQYQIDRDHEIRAQYPNAIGTPYRHRIPILHFKIRSHHDSVAERGETVSKKEKAVEKAVKPEIPAMWGSKEMASALKIEPKRLRHILRESGKGVTAGGEAGRYSWKPGDKKAIEQLAKVVEEFEKKDAKKKEETATKKSSKEEPTKTEPKKAAKKTAKKTAKKSSKKSDKHPDKAQAPEEALEDEGAEAGAVPEEELEEGAETEDEEVFEEEESEEEES
jgi:hypothetical protein